MESVSIGKSGGELVSVFHSYRDDGSQYAAFQVRTVYEFDPSAIKSYLVTPYKYRVEVLQPYKQGEIGNLVEEGTARLNIIQEAHLRWVRELCNA